MARKSKVCRVCRVEKPASAFYQGKYGTAKQPILSYRCKDCTRAAQTRFNHSERGRLLHFAAHLKADHGLTIEQFNLLVAAQGGKCAICGVTPSKRLVVDHDHSTRKVRGLLCDNCNLMLGQARDSRSVLAAAISYLSAHFGVVHAS